METNRCMQLPDHSAFFRAKGVACETNKRAVELTQHFGHARLSCLESYEQATLHLVAAVGNSLSWLYSTRLTQQCMA